MTPDQKHTCIFGQTGSGKTGAVIHLMEEALKTGVSVVAIDIKGDLANIVTAELPGVECTLFTPGADHGRTVSLLAKLADPNTRSEGASAILNLLGLESSKLQASYHSFLCAAVAFFGSKKCSLPKIIEECMDPSFDYIGSLPVKTVLPKSKREDLAVRLNNLSTDLSMHAWLTGEAIDFNKELSTTKVVVVSVAHLIDPSVQQMAINLILSEFNAWVWGLPGTDRLKTLLVIDECEGLIPPTPRNPPTKANIMALLKKGRAFGVGVVLATQNTKDIDYKALSNCATWVVGKLATDHDRKRIMEGVDMGQDGKKAVVSLILGLAMREFVVIRSPNASKWYCPDVSSVLSGPFTQDELIDKFPQTEKLNSFVKFVKSLGL